MLRIVMAKPIEVTIVNAAPLFSLGTDCATNVENCGESATTVSPQVEKINIKIEDENENTEGPIRQQIPDINKE